MAKAGFGTYREQGLIKNNAWLGEGSDHRWSSLEKLRCCQLRLPPIHTTSQQQLQQQKNGYDLLYVETSCTDGIRSNTARIRTRKIMCYSFVFGTLTIEDHIVVLEIFPLLIPFRVFMQHHTHGLPRKCRKHGWVLVNNWHPKENKKENIPTTIMAACSITEADMPQKWFSGARQQRKQRSSDLVLPNGIQ